MPKREAPASAQRPTQRKQKKKKRSLSCAKDTGALMDKDLTNESGKKYTERERHVSNSIHAQGDLHEVAHTNQYIVSAKGQNNVEVDMMHNGMRGKSHSVCQTEPQEEMVDGFVQCSLEEKIFQVSKPSENTSRVQRPLDAPSSVEPHGVSGKEFVAIGIKIPGPTDDPGMVLTGNFSLMMKNAPSEQMGDLKGCSEVPGVSGSSDVKYAYSKRKKRSRQKGKKLSSPDSVDHASHAVRETEGIESKICNKSNSDIPEGMPENADVNMDLKELIVEKDSISPDVKSTDVVESKKQRKRNRQRRRKGRKDKSPTGSSLQESSLSVDADKASLVAEIADNNMSKSKHWKIRKKKTNQNKLKKKTNQNKPTVTNSSSIEYVNMERRRENLDVSIKSTLDCGMEKKDAGVPPSLSEDKRAGKNDTKSLMGAFRDHVPMTLARGIEFDENAKANCKHPTSEEIICQSVLADHCTNRFNDVSKTATSEENQKKVPSERMEKASLPPSPIRGVVVDSTSGLPMNKSNRLGSFNGEDASFSFPLGDKIPEGRSDAHGSVRVCELKGGPALENSRRNRNSSSGCANTGRNELQEKKVACPSTDPDLDSVMSFSLAEAPSEKLKDAFSPRGSLIRFHRKKLLILDLNGLLADINQDYYNAHKADVKVKGKLVFKRPYCDDFLNFCFQNFELGIWSSRKKENVDTVVNCLMGDLKHNLLFCWDIAKCTVTGLKTIENMYKPLVLKELKKLWNKEEPDLPWEKGEYSPSNTLLVDDSPYKALRNPPYTAIFPHPYSYHNRRDNSLGPGGDLRVYLENLATADDVECYVRERPFGQPAITETDPHWNFYAQIIEKVEASLDLT